MVKKIFIQVSAICTLYLYFIIRCCTKRLSTFLSCRFSLLFVFSFIALPHNAFAQSTLNNDFATYLNLTEHAWTFRPNNEPNPTPVKVPGGLRQQGFLALQTFGTYELTFYVNPDMSQNNRELALVLGVVEEADQVWLNNQLLGRTGLISIEDKYPVFSMASYRAYPIAPGLLNKGENRLRILVQSYLMQGGIKGTDVAIMPLSTALDLQRRQEQKTAIAQMLLISVMISAAMITLVLGFFTRNLPGNHYYFLITVVLLAVSYSIDNRNAIWLRGQNTRFDCLDGSNPDITRIILYQFSSLCSPKKPLSIADWHPYFRFTFFTLFMVGDH